ncbi:hypothetical protein TNIN_249441 [Trichonephila inaurata madagascariensis]|uniref:Uncharacterized protein n=1 Tax=Trichonephila inaurata madagascariensis TaxID=2747483 RepID=A0A8X6XH99_9ARAC|nr:hypothetical protein TNIN_249441 [Trichonephila inaurata madagascariensis]
MSSTDHGHQEMLDGLPLQQLRPSDPHWTPNFAGNDTSRKYRFTPLLLVKIFAFKHFSSHFGALTCTEASGRGRGDDAWGHSDTLNPFAGHRRA